MLVMLYCLANNKVTILGAIPELIVAPTTLLGTFMTIPKMITKYLYGLFPQSFRKRKIVRLYPR